MDCDLQPLLARDKCLMLVQICQTGPFKAAHSLAGAVGLALHCDRVPFTLLSACKFSAALAFQPITAKEL